MDRIDTILDVSPRVSWLVTIALHGHLCECPIAAFKICHLPQNILFNEQARQRKDLMCCVDFNFWPTSRLELMPSSVCECVCETGCRRTYASILVGTNQGLHKRTIEGVRQGRCIWPQGHQDRTLALLLVVFRPVTRQSCGAWNSLDWVATERGNVVVDVDQALVKDVMPRPCIKRWLRWAKNTSGTT